MEGPLSPDLHTKLGESGVVYRVQPNVGKRTTPAEMPMLETALCQLWMPTFGETPGERTEGKADQIGPCATSRASCCPDGNCRTLPPVPPDTEASFRTVRCRMMLRVR